MNKLKLRAYQAELMNETTEAMKLGYKHIMVYAPQGSGKSVVLGYMTLGSMNKGRKVVILTHRTEIMMQNMSKMELLGMKVQLINSKTKSIDYNADCYCCMAQTVAARLDKYEEWREWLLSIPFIIVDEAHRGEMDRVLNYMNQESYLVGLSASILRSGSKVKQLGSFYDCIVTSVSTKELIEFKYLTPSKNYTFQAPKLEDVKVNLGTGDYVQNQLRSAFTKPERYGGVIENYKKLTPNTKAVAFTTGSEHCIALCQAFNDAGIKSKYILSKKTDKEYLHLTGERRELLNDFRNGEFDVIVNDSILDTGWDEPSLQTIILDFSTKSYSKFGQSVGRGSRLFKGKTHFTVLDFGGNIETHGIYERSDPPMSLWHSVSGGGVMATKECPKDKGGCSRLIPISSTDCPYCSYHFPSEREVYEVELQEYVDEQKSVLGVDAWVAKSILEGKSNNWILMQLCIKNPENQKKAFMDGIQIMKTKSGANISPSYWHFFKREILNKKRKA